MFARPVRWHASLTTSLIKSMWQRVCNGDAELRRCWKLWSGALEVKIEDMSIYTHTHTHTHCWKLWSGGEETENMSLIKARSGITYTYADYPNTRTHGQTQTSAHTDTHTNTHTKLASANLAKQGLLISRRSFIVLLRNLSFTSGKCSQYLPKLIWNLYKASMNLANTLQ